MHPSTSELLGLLSEPIYRHVFETLDQCFDISGPEAGATAALAQMAVRVGLLLAYREPSEAREELTRLVERAEAFARDCDDAMAEVMARTEAPELIP